MNLGENIYRFRTQKNMSQGDLADALEVSRQSVSKWENNSAVPELDKLMKMAQIFGITLDELVTGKESQRSAPAPEPPIAATAIVASRTQKTWSIVLLVAASVVFLFSSMLAGILAGLILASPLYIPGLICLLAKKRVGLKCAWAEFSLFVTYFMYASGTTWYSFWAYLQMLFTNRDWANKFNPISVVLSLLEWIVLVLLIVWTVYSYRRDAKPLIKRSILPICLGAAVYFLPGLLPLFSDDIPIRLASILSMASHWLKVALLTAFLVHLWPTFDNWRKNRRK